MEDKNFNQLPPEWQLLLLEAQKASEESYSPYSHFKVGAALYADKGAIVHGTNVENAAYGSCICAERTAIVSARSRAYKNIIAIAIKAERMDKKKIEDVTAPCGACRQMLYENACISGHDISVIMSNSDMSKIIVAKISELLPLGFGPKNLFS